MVPGAERRKRLGDIDGLDDNVLVRPVHAVGVDLANLGDDFLRSRVRNLTEDGVVVIQVRGRRHGDEELGTVGAWAGIGHGQQEWTVELQLWVELVLELVARATAAGAGGVAALNHEVIDDAVEDGAIVERAGLLALCVLGGVVLFALGQTDEVFNGYRCVVTEEIDNNIAVVGMHRCSCGLLSHANHCKEFTSSPLCKT